MFCASDDEIALEKEVFIIYDSVLNVLIGDEFWPIHMHKHFIVGV